MPLLINESSIEFGEMLSGWYNEEANHGLIVSLYTRPYKTTRETELVSNYAAKVRERCVLSPSLFDIFLEQTMTCIADFINTIAVGYISSSVFPPLFSPVGS